MLRYRLFLLLFLGLGGCHHPPEAPLPAFPEKEWPEGETPPSTVPPGLRYRILSVGGSGDFVILETPLHLGEGHGGSVFRSNKAVGRVRLTASQNGTATAADITAGSVRMGDQWEPDPH